MKLTKVDKQEIAKNLSAESLLEHYKRYILWTHKTTVADEILETCSVLEAEMASRLMREESMKETEV